MQRFVAAVACALLFALPTFGDGADDLFIQVYNLIQQSDSQRESGQISAARDGYAEALHQLNVLKNNFPNWNERVISYRLRYVSDKIADLKGAADKASAPPKAPTGSTTNAPDTSTLAPPGEVISQFQSMSDQIRQLSTDKRTLEAKLREALSAQPAPVDPKEFQSAVEKIASLQETNRALASKLDQQQEERKNLVDKVVADEAQRALNDANRQLLEQRIAANKLEKEKADVQASLEQLKKGPLKNLESENTSLKQQVGELKNDTERGKQVADLAGRLSRVETDLTDVRKKNESLTTDKANLERQLEDLRARSAEEGIVRIRKLETDLAIAKSNAEKSSTRAEEIASALVKEHQRNGDLETENHTLQQRITELSKSASENVGTVKTLEVALKSERSERAAVEQKLQVLQSRLDSFTASAASKTPDSTASKVSAERDEEVVQLRSEVGRLKTVLQDAGRHEAELEGALAQEQEWRKKFDKEKQDLESRLAVALAAPSKAPTKIVTANPVLERRVRSLEKERDDLRKKLASLTTQAADRLTAYRSARATTPRERAAQFRAERQL